MTDPNHIAEARKKVSRPQIREVFLRNGARIEPDRDDLPDWIYESAFELLELAAPAVQGGSKQPPLQLPDFITDPDDSDEVASLWDHGYKRGWNACLETVAKAMQPAAHQPSPDVAGLVEALKQILGWRELRSGQEFPIDRIEDVARRALAAYRKQGGE